MGLASSQARLISLTSRQHNLEYRAQRLLNNKMQLANESDAVYNQYMNALDSVSLATKQINSDGKVSWIKGNVNNLLRKDVNENTTGEVFFLQNLNDGKLYIPMDIGALYETYAGGTDEDIRNFVIAASGNTIIYTTIDTTADIKRQYDDAVAEGWGDIMTADEYQQYLDAQRYDTKANLLANQLYTVIPTKSDGIYTELGSIDANTFIVKLHALTSSGYFSESYSTQEKAVLNTIYNYVNNKTYVNDDGDTYKDPNRSVYEFLNNKSIIVAPEYNYTATQKAILTNYSNFAGEEFTNFGDAFTKIINESTDSSVFMTRVRNTMPTKTGDKYAQITDANANIFKANLNNIINFYSSGYSAEQLAVLTAVYDSLGDTAADYSKNLFEFFNNRSIVEVPDYNYTTAQQTALTNYSNSAGIHITNFGDALTRIISNARNRNTYVSQFFTEHDPILTYQSVSKYEKFLDLKRQCDPYVPVYETTTNNARLAKYWEEIYKAIQQAGWTGITDSQAQNENWTTNMIKSNLAILTTWDDEYETLSKTATELSSHIRELTDENYIERVSQLYEAGMAEINAKDEKIDNELNQLETERTAITTEIDGIKNIINDNVESHFKTFA